LKKVNIMDPENPDAYLDIGEIYAWWGAFDDAEKWIRKSLEKDPGYFSPYNEIGNLYYLQNRLDEAEEYYNKALERYPEYEDAYKGLGSINMARGNYEKARDYFLQAMKFKSEFAPEIRVFIALCHKEMKQEDEYERTLWQAIDDDKHYSRPYIMLMNFYGAKGEVQKSSQVEKLMRKNCVGTKKSLKIEPIDIPVERVKELLINIFSRRFILPVDKY